MSRWEPWLRVGGAGAAGAVLLLAFDPFTLWFLAPVSVALFSLLVRGQRWQLASWAGLAYGLAFFTPLLSWTPVQTGPIPWLALSLLQALFIVPLGAVTMLVQRLPLAPLGIAAAWVGQEALRSRIPWGGLSWGKLGFGQTDGPLLGLAGWGGSVGISAVVALIGGLLVAVVVHRGRWRVAPALGAVALTLVGPLVPQPPATGEPVDIAVVQGSVPEAGLDFNARADVITGYHSDLTVQLAEDVEAGRAPAPDLVIWAENSSDRNPYRAMTGPTNTSADMIERAAEAIGVPIHVGAVVPTEDGENVRNTSIVWDPETGPGQTYDKRHPMPFGEYIPFRDLARLVTDAVDRQPRDFVAGQEVGVLDIAGVPFAMAICFEVAFDNIVRDAVRAGGQVIMVPTNNATFGFAPMSDQQLAMSQVRAVEHGRPVVVSALAGISAIVAPDGSVTQSTELYTQDVLSATITPSTATTLATRLGEAPEFVLCALALLGAALGIRRGRQERTGATGGKAADADGPSGGAGLADRTTVPTRAGR